MEQKKQQEAEERRAKQKKVVEGFKKMLEVSWLWIYYFFVQVPWKFAGLLISSCEFNVVIMIQPLAVLLIFLFTCFSLLLLSSQGVPRAHIIDKMEVCLLPFVIILFS